MNASFPRLPMLQSIGRSSGIDMEEPPEDSHSGEGDERRTVLKSCNAESLNILINKFSYEFNVLNPGGYFCNKFASKAKNPSHLHCWKGSETAKHVHKMKQLVIVKSKLEFQKDIIVCLKSAMKLEEIIQKSVLSELDMLEVVSHNRIHCPIRTNLVELSELCDDLRVQMNFWSSIWKRLFCNCRLNDLLCEAFETMEKARNRFDEINARCLSCLNKLVTTGFRVLAHCDLDRIEYENLCSIVKGLEDYNLLVGHFKSSISRFGNQSYCFPSIAPLMLSDLLERLAHERSKYSAISCKEYLFGNADFLKEVQNFDFEKCIPTEGFGTEEPKPGWEAAGAIPRALSRMSDSLLSSYPPLMDFIRREKSFIENLLHAVCHVTTLLSLEVEMKEVEGAAKTYDYTTSSNCVLTFVESPSDSPPCDQERGASKRKTVSWNDSVMAVQANQIASQYFVRVWQSFVGNFKTFMEGFYWMGAQISGDHLGCLVLSDDVVSMFISGVLHAAAHKGMFPAVVHPLLLELSLLYLILPAQSSWKMNLSESTTKQSPAATDLKPDCDQTGLFKMLSDSLLSSADVFRNLRSSLDFLDQTSVNKAPLRFSPSFFSSYHSLVTCFTFSCSEALGVCHGNIIKSLAQRDLCSFLAASRLDLQALSVQLDEAYQVSSKVASSVEAAMRESVQSKSSCGLLLQHLRSLADEVNLVLDGSKDLTNMAAMSFKELCSQNAIQFFKTEMPIGKIWKRKDEQTQQQHSSYIEKSVEVLLRPVLAASQDLDRPEKLQVLRVALHEISTAWMNNILEKKIKFSYYGACQLEWDVMFLRSSVGSCVQEPDLTSRLLSEDIFEYLKSVVGLLKQQPNKNGRSNNSNSDTSSKSNSSKSGSKSNSLESSSPMTAKATSPNSPKGTASHPVVLSASNGNCQQSRPPKKNRGTGRMNSSKEEKFEKTTKPCQEGKPKFGRSAKVSTNSQEMTEIQNNLAFMDEAETRNDDRNTAGTIPPNKPPVDTSPSSTAPNENGVGCGADSLSRKGCDMNSLGSQQELCQEPRSVNKKAAPVSEGDSTRGSVDKDSPKVGDECNYYGEVEWQDNPNDPTSPLKATPSQMIARKDDWLALRVRRGPRSWPRLPLCFSGSIDSCGS